MSLRSGYNSDLVLNNLKINGKLTLEQPLTYDDYEVDNLTVKETATINDLVVTGSMQATLTGPVDATAINASGNSTLHELSVTTDASLNTVHVYGNVTANGANITPTQLGYVSGASSNIQTQIDTKAPTATPTFTGTVTIPTTQNTGFSYFKNDSGLTLADYASQYFGAIGANLAGMAELDFINTGYSNINLANSAFDWYIMTFSTAKKMLMRLTNNSELIIEGVVDALGGLTTVGNVQASTASVTGNLSAGSATVTGDLHVNGNIYGNQQSNMEVLTYHLDGTITLLQNSTDTANYVVMPSIYDGYSGSSSGTYNADQTSSAIHQIVISNITPSAFKWTIDKATGDNVNVYIVFLVVYGVSNSSYPKSYT